MPSSSQDCKASDRKAWALLTGRKILTFIPHILDIAMFLGCGGLVMLGSNMFNDYGGELKTLIDAGELPECLYYYPAGMFMMLLGAGTLMFWLRRRRRWNDGLYEDADLHQFGGDVLDRRGDGDVRRVGHIDGGVRLGLGERGGHPSGRRGREEETV